MTGYSYFAASQKLAEMIKTTIDANLTDEEAQALACGEVDSFLLKVESPLLNDLYEVGLQFREWLQDFDIRQKDNAYNTARTDKLRRWLQSH